ncbi:glycerophosphoryl diester phosphodiesterase [Thermogymnomonas acidicola]|uniref:Glycerophosphoryl diester phosphodiesterase n=1 Tax=Thermogymnomonas acidicola TaxID=399579 RepID=A0AA37BQZ3_9ARCH|nr:glycerophosphodiester phosphodiesterase [Thermogymnomonas acidicola]GGM72328.1 glycerophosphoryl diester phosphodiesterase [Thermogymnomonas acidicola]
MSSDGFCIVGHRGAPHEALENTLESFQAARRMGVGAVEFDVQLSRDGVPFLFHDFSTERLAGIDRYIVEMHSSQVRGIELQGSYRIPSLQDALKGLKGIVKFIELKTLWPDGVDRNPGIVDAVCSMVEKEGAVKECRIISFDPRKTREVRERYPGFVTGIDIDVQTLQSPLGDMVREEMRECDLLVPESGLARELGKERERCIPWTVNSIGEAMEFMDSGYMGIISDVAPSLIRAMGLLCVSP